MAKEAVKEFVQKHPEQTKYTEVKNIKQNDKANLELDLGDTADFRSEVDEKQQVEADAKYMLEEESKQEEETAIPKWATYSSPLTQGDSIKKELAQV